MCVEPGSFGVTKSISVRFHRPCPLLQVLRCEVHGHFSEQGTAAVEAILTDSSGDARYASCAAELVDLRRRKAWKQSQTPQQSKL